MRKRNKQRRLEALMYKNPIYDAYRLMNVSDFYKDAQILREFGHRASDCVEKSDINELTQIYIIGIELNLSETDIKKLWIEKCIEHNRNREDKKRKPKVERKDNKGAINRSSYTGKLSDVRYPSKKRPRSTWKRFYALFPRLAERDGWDGKTSKRMK